MKRNLNPNVPGYVYNIGAEETKLISKAEKEHRAQLLFAGKSLRSARQTGLTLLKLQKAAKGKGTWEEYIAANLSISKATVYRYIQVAKYWEEVKECRDIKEACRAITEYNASSDDEMGNFPIPNEEEYFKLLEEKEREEAEKSLISETFSGPTDTKNEAPLPEEGNEDPANENQGDGSSSEEAPTNKNGKPQKPITPRIDPKIDPQNKFPFTDPKVKKWMLPQLKIATLSCLEYIQFLKQQELGKEDELNDLETEAVLLYQKVDKLVESVTTRHHS